MDNTVMKWLDRTSLDYAQKVIFSDPESSLTFSRFNLYTKSIGTFLAGIAPVHSPIAVMSGRHVLTPALFLGVARAGCFYAPMDASMPTARLNQILEVIDAPYLLVDKACESIARSLAFSGKIIIAEEILDTTPDETLLRRASAQITGISPLYVIFTSGSTGRPKGVITSHQSLMCYIDAVCNVLHMCEHDVLGNQSPLDYIAAVRDIFIPIKTGASTVILPKSEFSMPAQLFDTLNRNRVTTLCWSVAGLELPAKLGAFDVTTPRYVTKVCFSGSVMPCRYLKIWQEHLPDALFVNQYGPTEATASCTYYVVKEKVSDSDILPIGVPYENYRILLLNEDHTQTPDGQIGEICVSGPILALGYYGDPQKTRESFLQNPLNTKYRELIYKTGDLGRFREDGNLEFHGRKDRQIKHMGHRIELDEIDNTARQIPGVMECCSLYDKTRELLYLFYTGEATARNISLYFRQVLPSFMVPRKIVSVPAIPRLPNGKIDMQKLQTYIKKKEV